MELRAGEPVVADSDPRYREYGGLNLGAAFFGWLVATAVAILVLALLGALGVAIGSAELSSAEALANADSIGLGGAVLFVVSLMLACYAGGYVAGRMSRFDGARQGAGVWGIGVVMTLLLAIAGAVFGSEYNLLAGLQLPTIPLDGESLATGGILTSMVVLVTTLLAALGGGRVGQRYHERVDLIGGVDATAPRGVSHR